jgi:hypothetical protein
MVDFNDSATVGTPAVDIFRIEALQAQANAFEAFESYKKQKERGVNPDLSITKARLVTWFLIHQPYIRRARKNDEYKQLHTALLVDDDLSEEKTIEIILYLNEILDKLNITKLDTRKVFDHTKWEQENKHHGL